MELGVLFIAPKVVKSVLLMNNESQVEINSW